MDYGKQDNVRNNFQSGRGDEKSISRFTMRNSGTEQVLFEMELGGYRAHYVIFSLIFQLVDIVKKLCYHYKFEHNYEILVIHPL